MTQKAAIGLLFILLDAAGEGRGENANGRS